MRAGFVASVALSFGLTLCAGATAFGQHFTFEDNFNRDAWDNAQTNTALPAWSTPTGNYIPPAYNSHATWDLEVRVVGQTFTVLANGSQVATATDADLQPGSLGVLAWGMRENAVSGVTTYPLGIECQWVTVACPDDATKDLNETWVLPTVLASKWTRLRTTNAAGSAIASTGSYGNLRWDFHRGRYVDDSNVYVNATAGAANIDFMGLTVAYDINNAMWTSTPDYEMKVRLQSTDNDGLGLLLRAQDANNFYRVTFCNESSTASTRPLQGMTVQKCRRLSGATSNTWTELYRDTNSPLLFNYQYPSGPPFDVKAIVQSDDADGVKISITVTNDPDGASPVTVTYPDIIDPAASDPLLTGAAGLFAWGNDSTFYDNYGGGTTPFVVTLDAEPVTLVGDVFPQGYNDWLSTYDDLVPPAQGRPAAWGIRLLSTGDLIDSSDGCQKRGGTFDGGTANDGTYVPYVLVKGNGYTTAQSDGVTPNDYTLKARFRSYDNDGMGLVFGYKDMNNYFRVGCRNELTSTYGFAQGTSLQKIVNGVTTNLYTAVPKRENQAGLWIKKFATGALEQVAPANLADGSGRGGIEFLGPRLVTGDVNWTDYTFEYVSEVRDDWGFGPLLRYQDESNYYRLTFSGRDLTPGGPPIGMTFQKVVGGVFTQLWADANATKPGNNDEDATAGFIYDGVQSETGFRIWRTRIILTGGTIKIEIDGILEDGTEYPNYYTATITDPAPLTNGKIGFHTYAQTANEFRDIKVTLAGEATPVFVDGNGVPDAKGWIDASLDTMTVTSFFSGGVQGGTDGVAAGAPISGFGIRPDINIRTPAEDADPNYVAVGVGALGVRDNRWKNGVTDSVLEATGTGTTDFDGPRAVVGEPNWQDYTYGVDIRQFDDDCLGVLFRYQDESNFYRLMFQSQADNGYKPAPRGVSVQKLRNGIWSELFYTADFIYTVAQRWRTEVTATGSHFDIKITEIDGPRAGTVHNYSFDDPTDPLLNGKVGVTAWGSSGTVNEGNTWLSGALNWTRDFSEGAVFDNVTVSGTMGRLPPDLDQNKKIDGTDLILWEACITGPDVPYVDPTWVCRHADVDNDGDVDSDDFGYFQRCFNGGYGTIDPTCVD